MTPSPARRVQWGIVDQAISSLANFLVTVFVARETGARGFGTFSQGLTLYIFLLCISRSLVTDPFVVRFSAAPVEDQRAPARDATGAALVVGLLAAPFVAAVGFIADGSPYGVMTVFALATPALLLQDAFRYTLFAADRMRDAALNDIVWLLTQMLVAATLLATGRGGPAALVGAFALGAGAGAVLGWRQTGIVPSPGAAWDWVAGQRDLGVPFTLEMITMTGMVQVALLTVAAVAGVVAIGELRAAMLLLGPLTVLFLGGLVVATPEAVRTVERSRDALVRLVVGLAVAMVAATVLWTTVLLLVPDSVGEAGLGANWDPARRLLPPVAVLMAGNACVIAAVVGLRAMGAARQSLRARIWAAPVVLAGGVAGALLGGAYGAAVGLAAAAWVDALMAARAFRRASGGVAPEPVVAGPAPPAEF